MNLNQNIQIILGVAGLAAVFGFIAHFIQISFFDIKDRNALDFSGLQYVSLIFSYYFWGAFLSFLLIYINSLKLSILLTFAVSFLSILGNVRDALEIDPNLEYIDRLLFQREILQIVTGFIIFPLIGFFVWFIKRSFDNSFKI